MEASSSLLVCERGPVGLCGDEDRCQGDLNLGLECLWMVSLMPFRGRSLTLFVGSFFSLVLLESIIEFRFSISLDLRRKTRKPPRDEERFCDIAKIGSFDVIQLAVRTSEPIGYV